MSEERLDSLLIENLIDNLQEVFFLFNQKGKMILWNNKVNQVTGYNNAEIIKLRPLDFFPKEEQKKINQKIETAFKTGKASIDANILSKEGELFPHLFTASFTYYKNEPCLYGVGLDIGDLQQKVFEINLMLNNTDEAFVILDKSFRIISFNQKFEENYFHLYGKHVSKLDNFLDLAKEKHREKLTLMYEKVLQGEFVTTESKILSPEGKLLIYDFTHKPAKNKSGETLGIFISAIDVTEKRKAQKKIRKSEERFKTMMKEGSDLIVILDNEGNYKFVSPNHLYYLGYSEGELMSTSSFSLIHPDDLDRIKDTFKLILVQKRVTAHPYRVKHKDSSWRWMQSTATNLFKDPTIGGIVINSTDVTDLVSIQKKLEANYELYNYIQKASNEAIFEWDIRTDIFTWGESFERIFGHDFDNKVFKLKDWIALVHPLDAEKEKNRWNLFLADKEQVKWTNEFRFLDSKGVYFFVEEVAYLVRDDSGEPIRMIGSIRDISHQKKETIKNKLLSDIGYFFKNEEKTILALGKSLEYLSDMCDCNFAEIWMVSKDRLSLQLYSNLESSEELRRFYISTTTQRKFNFGEGLPGKVWKTKQALNLEAKQIENEFIRAEGIKHLKLGMLSTIPLFYNGEVVAILMLGSKNSGKQEFYYKMYLKSLEHFLGAEIIRKQQQEELNQLFDNAPDILAVADASGHFRKVNPAFCQLLGYTAEEITSRPFFEFLHPEDLNTTNKEYRETVSGLRKADNFLNRYRCKSGEYKWISWKSSEIFGEEGLVYAFGRDVTERIELNLLLENANRLAQLGGWELDLVKNHIYWSKITKELHEVPEDYQPSLESGLEFYEEGLSRKLITDAINACRQDGLPFDLEAVIISQKGNKKWVRVIGKADKRDGKVIKLTGSFQDISARKKAELELRKSNERFEKASQATQDAIWDYEVSNDKLFWSGGYTQLFGHEVLEGDTDLGNWYQYLHPNDYQRIKNSWDKMLGNSEMEFWKEEYRYRKIDESYAVVEDRALIIRDDSGMATRIVGAMSDISKRKEYEASLKQLNKDLKQKAKELEISNAELEQFAYVASHDLQEPLRMISSFLMQLEKKYGNKLDEKAHQYIHFAVDGSKRMKKIILDLLDFSRVGKNEGDKTIIDLNEVVEEAILMHRKSIEEKEADIRKVPLPKLMGYKTPYFQLFYNLINNALKYSKENTPLQLDISVREEGDHWLFSIQDNGIGIEKEYYDRIFIIFQRLHGKDKYGGTGMGLSIVKKIIDNLNGDIWVESEYGKGSIFYFTLPKSTG